MRVLASSMSAFLRKSAKHPAIASRERLEISLRFYTWTIICRSGRYPCIHGIAEIRFAAGHTDMLILRVVALGPIHGYALAQRISRFPTISCACSRARCIRRCIGSKTGTPGC